jgi:hypothetical protein
MGCQNKMFYGVVLKKMDDTVTARFRHLAHYDPSTANQSRIFIVSSRLAELFLTMMRKRLWSTGYPFKPASRHLPLRSKGPLCHDCNEGFGANGASVMSPRCQGAAPANVSPELSSIASIGIMLLDFLPRMAQL